jgi:hypothetical protein
LLAASGDGVRIESEKTGQNRVSAAAELERFQSRVQAALLFIEQAVKQNDRGFSSSGEISSLEASVIVGTACILRRSRRCRWRVAGSDEV